MFSIDLKNTLFSLCITTDSVLLVIQLHFISLLHLVAFHLLLSYVMHHSARLIMQWHISCKHFCFYLYLYIVLGALYSVYLVSLWWPVTGDAHMSPGVLADLWKEEQDRIKILEDKMKVLLREKQVNNISGIKLFFLWIY